MELRVKHSSKTLHPGYGCICSSRHQQHKVTWSHPPQLVVDMQKKTAGQRNVENLVVKNDRVKLGMDSTESHGRPVRLRS